MEWNGMEWNGTGVSRMEWNGMEWNGMKHGASVSRSRVRDPAISPSESRSDEYRFVRD